MSESHSSVTTMASHLAHLLLIQERSKLGLKRSDITHQVLQGQAENRAAATRQFKDVLDEANRILENTVGYQIREIPGKSIFILVNTLDFGELEQFLENDPHEEAVRGLLCIMLGIILMSGGETREGDFWEFLAQLNVAKDDKNHETFGDVEKLVKTTLVRWHYLNYVKEKHGPSFFRWGFRAEHEFKKMDVLNFVASIHGNGRTARDFVEVFKELEEEEEQQQQRTASSSQRSSRNSQEEASS